MINHSYRANTNTNKIQPLIKEFNTLEQLAQLNTNLPSIKITVKHSKQIKQLKQLKELKELFTKPSLPKIEFTHTDALRWTIPHTGNCHSVVAYVDSPIRIIYTATGPIGRFKIKPIRSTQCFLVQVGTDDLYKIQSVIKKAYLKTKPIQLFFEECGIRFKENSLVPEELKRSFIWIARKAILVSDEMINKLRNVHEVLYRLIARCKSTLNRNQTQFLIGNRTITVESRYVRWRIGERYELWVLQDDLVVLEEEKNTYTLVKHRILRKLPTQDRGPLYHVKRHIKVAEQILTHYQIKDPRYLEESYRLKPKYEGRTRLPGLKSLLSGCGVSLIKEPPAQPAPEPVITPPSQPASFQLEKPKRSLQSILDSLSTLAEKRSQSPPIWTHKRLF